MRVVGVVLAAGESRRMGRLKALLPFGAHTVIEHVLQPLLQTDLASRRWETSLSARPIWLPWRWSWGTVPLTLPRCSRNYRFISCTIPSINTV